MSFIFHLNLTPVNLPLSWHSSSMEYVCVYVRMSSSNQHKQQPQMQVLIHTYLRMYAYIFRSLDGPNWILHLNDFYASLPKTAIVVIVVVVAIVGTHQIWLFLFGTLLSHARIPTGMWDTQNKVGFKGSFDVALLHDATMVGWTPNGEARGMRVAGNVPKFL